LASFRARGKRKKKKYNSVRARKIREKYPIKSIQKPNTKKHPEEEKRIQDNQNPYRKTNLYMVTITIAIIIVT